MEQAFQTMDYSDGDEQLLVERLRKSEVFIPELSLVAERAGQIIGQILLSKVKVVNENSTFEILSLAPVSVLPPFQRKGIGSALIRHAHQRAIELGYCSVVLIGHENYYPKFGYVPASRFGIAFPLEAPEELLPGALQGISGSVAYPKEFFA